MAGFYRSSYKNDKGEEKFLVVSQFEATDARRAFPCWDEPALKATFDVTLKVPREMVALSNMNVIEDKKEGDAMRTVKFATTPIMSTYVCFRREVAVSFATYTTSWNAIELSSKSQLLAFAVGDFSYVEAHTSGKHNGKPIQCRIYTLKGSEKQGEFALKVKVEALEYFAEIFVSVRVVFQIFLDAKLLTPPFPVLA